MYIIVLSRLNEIPCHLLHLILVFVERRFYFKNVMAVADPLIFDPWIVQKLYRVP